MRELVELLKLALGKSGSLKSDWDGSLWRKVLLQADNQAVSGVCNKAVEMLPDDLKPIIDDKIQLAFDAEYIAERNAKMNEASRVISDKFSSLGLRSCVLKGQGMAALYPWPEARTSGDVDLWVDCPHDKLVPILRSNWNVDKIVYHNAGINAFSDDVEVEIHFHPSWMNNPFDNRRLQCWFDGHSSKQFDNFQENLGFCVPDSGFNIVYCMIHCLRHIIGDGLGLRQMMDYYFVLIHSTEQERREAVKFLSSVHLKRFTASMMYALGAFFGLEKEYMLCPPDRKYGEKLIREVERSGNFGLNDSENEKLYDKRLAVREYHKLRRLSHFIGLVPSEVIWTPYFQIWHTLWRKRHRYI